MKKSLKKIAVIPVLFTGIQGMPGIKAQEINAGADLVSNYVWRGSKCGDASFQPSISLGYKGLSFTAWGSTDFTGDAFELDLTAAYAIGSLELALTDYYVATDINTQPYFDYKRGAGHVFEGTIAYTISEKIPLKLSWNTYFAGTDNAYSKQDYSTYVEASYPFALWGVDMGGELGITPWKGAYADGFNVVNIGITASKTFQLSGKFSLSPYTKLIFNPADNKAFMVFGVTI